MRVLVYYQSTSYSLLIESILKWLDSNGYHIFMLVIGNEDKKLEKNYPSLHNAKIEYYTATAATGALSYFQYTRNFINCCKRNQIDIVFSHLQLCNLFANLGRFFISAKVLPTRHHIDVTRLIGNKKSKLIDGLVNKLSSKIVVLSETAKEDLIVHEGVSASKIEVIPLGYDFQLSPEINSQIVANISAKFSADILLITVARMETTKRHDLSVRCLKQLVEQGIDAKLVLTNQVTDNPSLSKLVENLNLSERVFFIGHQKDIQNYMAAADFLLHPSVSESSNQVIREAAMAGTPSILVDSIGDFNEYIINRQNAFVVNRHRTVEEMAGIILNYKEKPTELKTMAKNLEDVTKKRFSVHQSMPQYLKLANDLINSVDR